MTAGKKLIIGILFLGLVILFGGAVLIMLFQPKPAPDQKRTHARNSLISPEAELSLSYSPERVNEWWDTFSIKIIQKDSSDSNDGLDGLLKKIAAPEASGADIGTCEAIRDLVTKPYQIHYSGPILMFLAKFCVNINEPARASVFLEDIREAKDAIWSPLALALLGRLATDTGQGAGKAKECFSRILLEYPESPEITYADEMLKKIR